MCYKGKTIKRMKPETGKENREATASVGFHVRERSMRDTCHAWSAPELSLAAFRRTAPRLVAPYFGYFRGFEII